MSGNRRIVRIVFALGTISIGALLVVYGYGVLLFGPIPATWIPLFKVIGYVSAAIMLGTGAGLLFDRSAPTASRVLLPFLLLWTLSRVPVTVGNPGREISWFAVGEVGVLAAGAIVLFAWLAESRGAAGSGLGATVDAIVRQHGFLAARLLLGLSLLTFGLSHFFEFAARTVSLVPSWLPYRTGWAYLTGAGQFAAGLGLVFSVYPRLAAASEAAMLSLFTVLVWIPAVIEKPKLASNWVEFLFTFALAGAAWVVAESLPGRAAAVRAPAVPSAKVEVPIKTV